MERSETRYQNKECHWVQVAGPFSVHPYHLLRYDKKNGVPYLVKYCTLKAACISLSTGTYYQLQINTTPEKVQQLLDSLPSGAQLEIKDASVYTMSGEQFLVVHHKQLRWWTGRDNLVSKM